MCVCKSYLVFPFFVQRAFRIDFEGPGWHGGGCTACTVKCGCALRLFSTNGSFRYKFPVRRHCLSCIWWWTLTWYALGLFGVGSVTIPGWAWAFWSSPGMSSMSCICDGKAFVSCQKRHVLIISYQLVKSSLYCTIAP